MKNGFRLVKIGVFISALKTTYQKNDKQQWKLVKCDFKHYKV